jgi:hypothetical protein
MFAYKHTRKPADYTVETRGLAEYPRQDHLWWKAQLTLQTRRLPRVTGDPHSGGYWDRTTTYAPKAALSRWASRPSRPGSGWWGEIFGFWLKGGYAKS